MRNKSLFLLILIAFLVPFAAAAPVLAQETRGPAVLELFTSQKCSACPPADELARWIDEKYSDVLVLGCHITFFDRPGSKDPLSQEFCDARQGAYRDGGITKKVYTPQVIVNGRFESTGSDAQGVINALQKGGPLPKIELSLNGKYLDIELPALSLKQNADVWLISYDQMRRSGKNKFVHPVTNITKLMAWSGKKTSMSFPVSGSGHYAVIAQRADYTDIIAAGKTK